MPIYEYECTHCEKVSEFIQKFSDPPKKKCPHCGGRIRKVMSMNAFHLKGDGWYVTDYKGKNSSTISSPDSHGETGGEKKESSSKKESPKKEATAKDKA